MAEKTKKSFPTIPAKHWWAVRELFKKSVPKDVDPTYLASALDMSEVAAKTNVAPALRAIGIIDEDGKPTDRAIEWRDDLNYPKVCKAIVEEVYPRQLRDLVSDPSDREAALRWFGNTTGAGENAVGKMVSFFLLLVEADPAKKPTGSVKRRASSKPAKPKAKKASKAHDKAVPSAPERTRSPASGKEKESGLMPAIHLNLQIHISPDASPEQIDAVFKSMAKHLKQLKQ